MYSRASGVVAGLLAVVFAVLNWIYGYNAGIAAYSLILGIFLLFFESSIPEAIPSCRAWLSKYNEDTFFGQPIVRAQVYFAAALPTFTYVTPCIGSGLVIAMSALIHAAEHVYKYPVDRTNLSTNSGPTNVA